MVVFFPCPRFSFRVFHCDERGRERKREEAKKHKSKFLWLPIVLFSVPA
jgi:hypothetical protein